MVPSPRIHIVCLGFFALLTAGCEPDDPAVRKELVEMRTALANTRLELDETKAALAVAKSRSERANFLETDELASSLRMNQSEIKSAIAQAFPQQQLESMNLGNVDTPFTMVAPYSTTVSFRIKDGGRVMGPYTIRIFAGRDGTWVLPTAEQFAASAGIGSTSTSGNNSNGGSSRMVENQGPGIAEDRGVRQINWGDGGGQSAAPQQPQPPSNQGSGAAPTRQVADPMPGAADTRQINW